MILPCEISEDHKPNLERERVWILEAGGRIQSFRTENGEFKGTLRVWLKDKDMPGLAMTRSMADSCGV